MEPRLSRRDFVGGVTAVIGFDPLNRRWVTAGSASGPLDDLPPLTGKVVVDPAALTAAADDFGHLTHHRPRAVLRPEAVSDVAAMVRFCHKHRLPVAARGEGHTTYGQAQAGEGLVIDMRLLRAVEVGTDTVVVQAGARWSEVLRATLAEGLTPPVLTDYLELSVGGTLSAGGIGGTTHRHGAQVDNVAALEVVTGTGEQVVCSAARRSGLFHAALAGLGQCAIITRVTLRLAPAPLSVRRYQLYYPSVTALTADQRRVVRDGRFDYLEGQIQPTESGGWQYVLEAGAFVRAAGSPAPDDRVLLGGLRHLPGTAEIADLAYFDFLNRLAESVAYLESIGEWERPHPWWNTFLPDAATDTFVSSTMTELTPADIGLSGVILLYPLHRSKLRTPLLRLPDQPLAFLFALLRTASPGAATATTMVAANHELYRQARAAGATQYPVGSIPMTSSDWKQHFGPLWPAFTGAKRLYDPAGILTPGQAIFPTGPAT